MSLKQNFTMHAGDTYKIDLTINDFAGSPVDITGAVIEFAISSSPHGDPLWTKSIGNGITITDGPAGQARMILVQSDTESLSPNKYAHETKLIVSGERDTVLVGYLTVRQSILK